MNTLINADRIEQSIRARFNPVPTLTPRLLGAYLDSFRLGFFRNIALAWDILERRDYKLQTVAPKRKKAVARHGWEILTLDDSPAAQQQKLVLEYFYNHLTATNVLEENETGGLALLIRQMMDAIGKRYAVHEIVWTPVADALRVEGRGVEDQTKTNASGHSTLNHQPSTLPSLTATFRFCPLWWFEGTQGRLRFLPTEFAIYGVDMPPGEWLVTVGDGLMEACSIAWIYKNLPLRDWLAYTEKFGTPGIVGKTDAALASPEWEEFAAVVKNFSQNWSSVISKGNEVELIQPKTGAGEGPFAPLIEKMDRAITTLWRGGDLGTMSSHNAAGASLQADESEILEMDDAQLIGETLTAQVSRHVLRYHFGDTSQLAYIKIRTADRKDAAQALQVDQFLLQAGAPIAVKDALERYVAVILTPTADVHHENVFGPFFDEIKIAVRVMENVTVNQNPTNGTNVAAADAAEKICALLHHFQPDSANGPITARRPSIELIKDPSNLVYDCHFRTSGGLSSIPPQTATPVITASSGQVTITCATSGAAMFYTLDGSNPSPRNGTFYTAPFTPGTGHAVKARAWLAGYLASETATIQT